MSNQERKRKKNILSFFQPTIDNPSSSERIETHASIHIEEPEPPSKSKSVVFDETSLERDPGLRIPMLQHPVNHRDEIRRAYIKMGPYQPKLSEYPRSESGKQHRRFQYTWFKKFPWLEYSPSKDAVFCFPCYLFELSEAQQSTFTIEGFKSWKRVNDGAKCAFLSHMGSSNSTHNKSSKSVVDLMNVTRHIDVVMNRETSEHIQKNGLRLAATIECVHWLSLQGCGLRGHDESSYSLNRGNFIEMLKLLGKWNANCPYAYYVHCFAHRLQLALVGAAEKEISIWLFFSNLTTIVNLVTSSSKRNAELQSNQVNEIARSVVAGERETGRGANQIGTLHRAGTTRWSSHFDSICSLIDMYDATINVLENIIIDGTSTSMRGEAGGSLIVMKSFDFIFILHLMQKIMGITNLLCRALQQKSLDIISAMDLVSTTKELFLRLRNDGFDILLSYVKSFCTRLDVDIPEMSSHYKHSTRSCKKKDTITVEHHFHYDIFNVAIDFQLEELNSRFSDETVELLILSSALDPKDNFKWFNIDKICTLAEKYYPEDFTEQERHHLRCQLQHFELDVVCHEHFELDVASNIDSDSIIDEYYTSKNRRSQLQ
ncbi:uncharacterized protein [Primulina eburnea]|uniref:uncharacterized protein n=1 Tax=Primulina eburnea TaxID=1245227 RepID=UPI003C6C2A1B